MKGLIAFSDILGYQSFLWNNNAIDSALNVMDIISNAPKKAIEYMISMGMEKEIHEKIEYLIFSDTIVLMLKYPEDYNPDGPYLYKAFPYFIFTVACLKSQLFLEGLPLRCVIHEGEFVIKDTCIAGKAVVEAYKMSESLDLSAMVLSPELSKKEEISKTKFYDILFVDYLTPMKNFEETKFVHFNWLMAMEKEYLVECVSDVETFVLKSFWAHKKDCPISVDKKISATCKLIRKLVINGKKYEGFSKKLEKLMT